MEIFMPQPDNQPQALIQLRTGSAPKLGRGSGNVHFELLQESAQNALVVRLTGNDGGGYFGRDAVAFSTIRAVVDIAAGQPFPSKMLKDCFSSRSSNNAGFLACVLRAEGLLTAAADSTHLHQRCGDWDAWEQACLVDNGTSNGGSRADLVANPETSKKDGRPRRKASLTADTVPESCSANLA